MGRQDFSPRVGGVKVVADVIDDQAGEIVALVAESGFDVRRYYPPDLAVGLSGPARGYTRLGAERARRFTRHEEAAVLATFNAVLDKHGLIATIVGIDTWEAGGDDGPLAAVREPRQPEPRVLSSAACPTDPSGASAAEAHADSLGLTVRLMGDGWYTSDYRIGRVTADLLDGLIIKATPGVMPTNSGACATASSSRRAR